MVTSIKKKIKHADPKDACGVFVTAKRKKNADGHIRADHETVEQGREALAAVHHRSAMSPDGTVDGAGIQTEIFWDYFNSFLTNKQTKSRKPFQQGNYGIGAVFLPEDTKEREAALKIIKDQLEKQGLRYVIELKPEVNPAVLTGKAAALHAAQPLYHIVFEKPETDIAQGAEGDDIFEGRAYRAMTGIERECQSKGIGEDKVSIASMSGRTMVTKGLVAPAEFFDYFTFLQNALVKSRFLLGHVRYSTNTTPAISRVQPFKRVAHNGEFNSVRTNRSRAIQRMEEGDDDRNLVCVLHGNQSDTQSFDQVVNNELARNVSLVEAIARMMPPSFRGREDFSPEVQAMFEWWSTFQDPWEGPAHIIGTDGRYIVVHVDKSGLRPSSFSATDERFYAGSEELLNQGHEKVEAMDATGAAGIVFYDIETGEYKRDLQVLEELAARGVDIGGARATFAEALAQRKAEVSPSYLKKGYASPAKNGVALQEYEAAAGWHAETKSDQLKTIAVKATEKVSSMGDDASYAVLSQEFWPLSYYLMHNFNQVSAPALDYVREQMNMSTHVWLGPKVQQGNQAKQIPLESPILKPGMVKDIVEQSQALHIGTKELSITFEAHRNGVFDVANTEEAMKAALEKLSRDAVQAVSQGAGVLILSDTDFKIGEAMIPAVLAVSAVHIALKNAGLSEHTSIIINTHQITNPHDVAMLLSMGATAVEATSVYGEMLEMAEAYRSVTVNRDSEHDVNKRYGTRDGDAEESFTRMMDKVIFTELLKVALGENAEVTQNDVNKWFNYFSNFNPEANKPYGRNEGPEAFDAQFGSGAHAWFDEASKAYLPFAQSLQQSGAPLTITDFHNQFREWVGARTNTETLKADVANLPEYVSTLQREDGQLGILERFFLENAQKGMDSGIKSIISKVGIPDINAYIGGHLCDAIGLDLSDPELSKYLPQDLVPVLDIKGHTFHEIAENQTVFAERAQRMHSATAQLNEYKRQLNVNEITPQAYKKLEKGLEDDLDLPNLGRYNHRNNAEAHVFSGGAQGTVQATHSWLDWEETDFVLQYYIQRNIPAIKQLEEQIKLLKQKQVQDGSIELTENALREALQALPAQVADAMFRDAAQPGKEPADEKAAIESLFQEQWGDKNAPIKVERSILPKRMRNQIKTRASLESEILRNIEIVQNGRSLNALREDMDTITRIDYSTPSDSNKIGVDDAKLDTAIRQAFMDMLEQYRENTQNAIDPEVFARGSLLHEQLASAAYAAVRKLYDGETNFLPLGMEQTALRTRIDNVWDATLLPLQRTVSAALDQAMDAISEQQGGVLDLSDRAQVESVLLFANDLLDRHYQQSQEALPLGLPTDNVHAIAGLILNNTTIAVQRELTNFFGRSKPMSDYTNAALNTHQTTAHFDELSLQLERNKEHIRTFGDLYSMEKRQWKITRTDKAAAPEDSKEAKQLAMLGLTDGITIALLPDQEKVRDAIDNLSSLGYVSAELKRSYPTAHTPNPQAKSGKNAEPDTIVDIMQRSGASHISRGAYTDKAHAVQAYAMNNLPTRGAGSGEGGIPAEYINTRWQNPSDQIASGRFGDHVAFLSNLPPGSTICIKIGQGAKAGMGGQVPAFKVDVEVAGIRGGIPFIDLISPSNNHDLYSIEDLQQLIHELKGFCSQYDSETDTYRKIHEVEVKLVGMDKIGTIACGVAKAGADIITIASHMGGTGAAPDSALRHSGNALEMSLREAHLALCAESGLRQLVKLNADASSLNEYDVMQKHFMGADYVSDGTMTAILARCVMKRNCHSKCPAGLTTNPEDYRGLASMTERFYINRASAQQKLMDKLSIKNIDDCIGDMSYLTPMTHEEMKELGLRPGTLDLDTLMQMPDQQKVPEADLDRMRNRPRMERELLKTEVAIWEGENFTLRQTMDKVFSGEWERFETAYIPIKNSLISFGVEIGREAKLWLKPRLDRRIHDLQQGELRMDFVTFAETLQPLLAQGTTLSEALAELRKVNGQLRDVNSADYIAAKEQIETSAEYGQLRNLYKEMVENHAGQRFADKDALTINLLGAAGESFGCYLSHGVHVHLKGVAQNFAGKSMSGGILSIERPDSAKDLKRRLLAKTCVLYGARSGEMYVDGAVGERAAVRNSGATLVAEGLGDFAGEYMTNGTILNIGKVGRGIMAGASGGLFFQYDPDNKLSPDELKKNKQRMGANMRVLSIGDLPEQEDVIKTLLQNQERYTKSTKATEILQNWDVEKGNFRIVVPEEMYKRIQQPDHVEQIRNTFQYAQRDPSPGVLEMIARKENVAGLGHSGASAA